MVSLYAIAITLIFVMDPLGNIPVFLSILRKFSPAVQIRIIIRESIIAFVVLVLFVFFGQYILHGLHITAPALSIAGGLILFIIAIRMIFPAEKRGSVEEDLEEPLIVPLAVPLTAGPSAMAVVLLYVTRDPGQTWMIFLAVAIASLVFMIIMLCARYLMRVLGRRVLVAIERLMGMILTTMSVQMFLSGVMQAMQG
ncbi:MAG: hypothetical protein A3F41_00010 [Coxiella sp. RIFCSPHIGHO2_12_FULL_44_14]|nr:MAG: hypothetical protein A3F41_00010 [Coxiella sp. RIFCSPHIGHO2_12_FULL_44_14]